MSDGLLATTYGTLVILLVALLAHEPFRWLGARLGRGIDPAGALFTWVRAVATALIAGLVARLVLFPVGVLEEIPLAIRLASLASGCAVFFAAGRRMPAGVAGAATVMLTLHFLTR